MNSAKTVRTQHNACIRNYIACIHNYIRIHYIVHIIHYIYTYVPGQSGIMISMNEAVSIATAESIRHTLLLLLLLFIAFSFKLFNKFITISYSMYLNQYYETYCMHERGKVRGLY